MAAVAVVPVTRTAAPGRSGRQSRHESGSARDSESVTLGRANAEPDSELLSQSDSEPVTVFESESD